ncbi:MAG: hypothetical protein ACE5H2_10125, partial [Terriglobia bacterium]
MARWKLSRLLVLGLIALAIILILWLLPKWQASKLPTEQQFISENAARRTLAQILGGTTLLI